MYGGGCAIQVNVGLYSKVPSPGIIAPKNSKKCFSRGLVQGDLRMWGKRESFGEEKGASWRVFASFYWEGTVTLTQWKTSRSAQRTEDPEAGPCISLSLCDPCNGIPC